MEIGAKKKGKDGGDVEVVVSVQILLLEMVAKSVYDLVTR